jgi:hypothetical protein
MGTKEARTLYVFFGPFKYLFIRFAIDPQDLKHWTE